MLDTTFEIEGRPIGEGYAPYFIAEAGSNFDQSMDKAKEMIEVAKQAGADAVKFQLFRPESLCSPEDEAFAIVSKIALDPDWVPDLMAHAKSVGITWLASVFDEPSLQAVEEAGIAAHKVASSETTKLGLLRKIARTGKPVFLSTGMCDLSDVTDAVALCLEEGNSAVSLMQCHAVYPLEPADANLRVMDVYAAAFDGIIGYSDHTLGTATAIAAVGRGAKVIEKHFTLDRSSDGPDHFYALEPAELTRLVSDIHDAHNALGSADKRMLPPEREYGRRDGLHATRDIAVGEQLGKDNTEVRRPALGIRSRHALAVSGATVRCEIKAGQPIRWEDID